MVGVAVPPGDPVRGGDDIDPGFEYRNIQILVGEDPVEGQHIGFGGDDLLDGAGGDDTDGIQSGDLAGVAADLLRRVAVQPDEFQIGMRADAFDHLGADIAGGDLEHPDGLRARRCHGADLSG